MSNQDSGFLLKILSGNHQGAEVIFSNESAVIGSDQSSDVVLSDSLIEPRHIELTFSEDGIILKPLSGKVFLDGKLVKDESVKVEEFQFITIGSTHIVIGPSGKTWPFISAADAPQIESENTLSNISEEVEIQDNAPRHLSKDVKKLDKKKLLIFGGGVLFLLGVAIALLISVTTFGGSPQQTEKPDTMTLLNGAVRELNFSNRVAISRDPSGRFEASGYVYTDKDLSEIRKKLISVDPYVKVKVFSESSILSEISSLLSGVESKPRVRSDSNGVFVITGYAYDENKWNKIRRRILEDVVGITDLQDEVILPSKAINMVRPVIAKYKLINKVGIAPQPDGIAIVGLVSSDEEENWNRAKLQIEQMFSSDVLLKNYVKVSDPEVIKRQYFGSEINSVSIGENGMNWVGLKDGTKYMVGATLSNGYSIKEITPDNIVLTNGIQTVVLKIGELK